MRDTFDYSIADKIEQTTEDNIEIIKFNLRAGSDQAAFWTANEEMNLWLQHQPGFIMRRLCHIEDDSWLDMVHWESESDAATALTMFRREMCKSAFVRMIEPSSIQMAQGQTFLLG